MNSHEEGLVRLILDGISLRCSSSAPIFIKNADKAILVLAEDVNNYVADEAIRTIGDSEEDDPYAAIFSKENLTICGAGTLTVDANYADGMDINGSVVMAGGTLLFNGPTTNDVYYGGSSTGTPVDGLYEGGVYTAGTKYASFTISSVTTNVVGGGSGWGARR